jgi:hypothetical protein
MDFSSTHTDSPTTDNSTEAAPEFIRLRRRLMRHFSELGITCLPSDWATFTGEGVLFSSLTTRQAQELVWALDRVCSEIEAKAPAICDQRPEPGPYDQQLPGIGALPAPTGHLVVVA